MAVAALQEGEVFAGRYRIVRELASGGMGAVYEVVHAVTERRCALKVMLSHTVERETLRKRFMQESRLAAQIGSEYIVDVLDAGVDEVTKAPFLVMELLEGEDLGQRLLRLGPLTARETVTYLWNVALALDRTHQAGIVHRDLKASNLFLTRREDGSPFVKVLDFGVAKVLPLGNSGEQRTQTVGTPIYMAPEQFRADGRITPATDIYALGMLAHTLLVGVHYWTKEHENCENPFAFASIAVHGPKEAPSLRAAREEVFLPLAFDDWFAKATNRWPQDRFATATAAVGALAEALDIEVPAVPLSLPGPVPGAPDKLLPFEALASTVESPSSRLTGSGFGTLSTRHGSSADDAPFEQHTAISLSVTSGGLSPVEAGIEERPHRSKMGAVVLGAAALLAVGAVVVGQSWRSSHDARKVNSGAPRVTTSASAAASVAKPPPVPPEEQVVTRIEELPLAPPDNPRREPAISAEPADHRSSPLANHDKPRSTERKPASSHPSDHTAPVDSHDTSSSGESKLPDRDALYGRY